MYRQMQLVTYAAGTDQVPLVTGLEVRRAAHYQHQDE